MVDVEKRSDAPAAWMMGILSDALVCAVFDRDGDLAGLAGLMWSWLGVKLADRISLADGCGLWFGISLANAEMARAVANAFFIREDELLFVALGGLAVFGFVVEGSVGLDG